MMISSKIFFARMDRWEPSYGAGQNTVLIQNYEVRNEELNFVPDQSGLLRAFVRPAGRKVTRPRKIRIEGIDPLAKGFPYVNEVLVVFFATPEPKSKLARKVKILGWIKHAKVYREQQEDEFPTRSINGKARSYNIVGSVKNATLLPIEERKFYLQWPGRPWLSYPKKPMAAKAFKFIEEYSGSNLLAITNTASIAYEIGTARTQYLLDKKRRDAIEEYSVQKAVQYYSKVRGYVVTPQGKPYDLHCERTASQEILLVEVKGTQTTGSSITLTRNEVNQDFLTAYPGAKIELFVMHSITFPNGSAKPSGGICVLISNWKPSEHDLQAFQYNCALDRKKCEKLEPF